MKRPAAALLGCVAVMLLIAVAGVATIPSVPTGTWQPMGSMAVARSGAAAVLLQDHRVLITGGNNGADAVNSAEMFNADGSFATVSAMGTPRSEHAVVVLADGRVLVAGGVTAGGGSTNSAETYDPGSDSWSVIPGGMVEARSRATATLLKDGRVLIAGGQNGNVPSSTLEIFDPNSGQFSFAGTLSAPRMGLASARLSDGRVLITGGSNGSVAGATSDVFDPATNTVSAGPAMTSPRVGHSATSLLDGRVLIAGGNNGSADLASAEVFDPALGGFAGVASNLGAPRRDHTAILLSNNNAVLLVGGTSAGNEVTTAETFTPWAGAFAATGAPAISRQQAAVSGLNQDGLLLMAGGSSAGAAVGSAELYGFATVKTDKDDYAPATVVTITGSGWQPGETVTLTLVESPYYDTHPVMTAVADGQGRIANTDFSPDEHDLGIRFYLTAVGSQSGSQAQNTFTDANNDSNTLAITCTSNSLVAGNTTTCTATETDTAAAPNNGSPLGTISWSINPTAEGTFSPTPCTLVAVPSTVTSTCSTTFTAKNVASGTINASYSRANNNWANNTSSNNFSMTVTKASTNTTVTSGTTPSVFGQSVTFTANVTVADPGAGTVTGNVTFKDGAATLATGILNGSGVATFTTSALGVATHSITAVYNGDSNFNSSTSSAISQAVNQAATSTNLTSPVNPSAVGQSVTFTATVTATAPGAGTATGTVTFKDGATTIGTGTVNASGVATFATMSLALGPHSITATYGGDTNFTGSTSSLLTQTVTQATSSTSLVSSANPSVFGQSVTFTATVTGASGTPTGTVTFKDGAATLGTGTLGSGQATFSTSSLSVATHSITAVYGGDSNYTGSTSSALSQVVNQADTSTALSSSPNPSLFGQAAIFTVTVTANSPASGTPTGSVQIKMGTTVFGTGTLSGGEATVSISNLPVATNGLKAFYSGDTNFKDSQTQSAYNQVVNKASTTTGVVGSPSPSNYGQAVTLTATVAVVAPGAGTPTGAVNFYDGGSCAAPGTSLGSGILSGSAPFQASTTTSATALDAAHSPHTVLACYAGDGSFLTSNGSTSQTVNKAAATATITASDKTYDTTNVATITNCTVNGKIGTDDVSCTTSNPTFASANASPVAQTVTATVALAGAAAGNYTLGANTTATTTAKINAKSVMPTITADDKDYDTTTAATIHCSLTGVLSGDNANVTCTGTGSFADANAGTGKTVTSNNLALGGMAAGNYGLSTTSASTTATIRKVDATISVTGYSVMYNALAHTATGSATGIGGADLSAYLNLTGTTRTDAGDYPADAWAFSGAQNYNDKNGTVHDHIDKAAANITVTAYNLTYDGDPHAATGSAKGVGGVDLSANLNLSGTTHTSAGNFTDTWTFTGSTNYNDATSTVNDVILKADPTINATGGTFTYDGNPHGGSATATGVKGEALTPVNVAYTAGGGVLLTTAPVNAGNYSVAARYAGDTNYNPKQSSASPLIINKANAQISVTPYSVTYDGDPHTATGSATGVETLTPADLTTLLHLGGTTHTTAGDYPTDSWTFDGNENYIATSGTVHDFIDKADPTVTASGGTFIYDGNPHGGSATAMGVKGEALTPVNVAYTAGGAVLLTTAPVNAGNYSVAARFAGDANYKPKQSAAAPLVISKANAHVSVTSYDVTYDGNPHTAAASATGVETPTPADLSSLLHVGGTTHTSAGDYPADGWTFDGNENYLATSGTVHDQIAKADPIVTATGGTFTYDGNPHGGTGSAKGVQNEDLVPVNVAYTVVAAPPRNPGDLLTSAPVTAGNYLVAARYAGDTNYNGKQSAAAALTISKADAHLTVTGYNVTYDTNAHTATGTASGVESPTAADLTGLLHLGGTTHTNAGDFTDNWTFDGNENYNAASGTVLDHIEKANANVNVTGYSLTYNTLAHTATGTATGVGGENLAAGLNLTGTSHTDAGDYPSDPWSFSGGANYKDQSGTVHDHIDKADASVNVTGYSVTYNGAPHTATVTATGVGGENLASGLNLTGTSHTDAGDYLSDPWSFSGAPNYNDKSGTVHDHIDKASVTATAGGGSAIYDGNAKTPTPCAVSGAYTGDLTCTNNPASVGPNAGTTSMAAVVGGTGLTNFQIAYVGGSFTIDKATSTTTVTFEPGPYVYRAAAFIATASASGAGGLTNVSVTPIAYSGDCTNVTAGGCTASATYSGDANHYPSPTGQASIMITPATPTITVTGGNYAYDGNPHPASGTATGIGGAVAGSFTFVYTPGGNAVPTLPGSYSATGSFTSSNPNYKSGSGGPAAIGIGYGVCSSGQGGVILPPINSDGTSVYQRKGGSTIPVKFKVCAANGSAISNPAAVFGANSAGSITMLSAVRGTVTVVNEDTIADIPDVAFRFDGSQWTFNMATSNLQSGNTYTFRINLANGYIVFMVGVK